MRRTLMFAVCAVLASGCGASYRHEGGKIVYVTVNEGQGKVTQVVEGADEASFMQLDDTHAKDKTHVYVGATPIPGALPASYAILSPTYSKDAAHVYSDWTVIPDADAASFAISGNPNFGQDKNEIFSGTIGMRPCDRASFHWLRAGWAVDSTCAYNALFKMPNAHPGSFVALNDTYAKDEAQAYTTLRPYVIPDADAASFELLPGACQVCARDRNRCYSWDKPTACKNE
jgi:hypothetical protein